MARLDGEEQQGGTGAMSGSESSVQRFVKCRDDAQEIIEDFLADEGWDGGYGMEFQASGDGGSDVWAFWGKGREYTSYLKLDGRIESYGI